MGISSYLVNNGIVQYRSNKKPVKLKIFIILILLLASKSALSASAGLGVSLNNGPGFIGYNLVTPTVLIPIEINEFLLIEPFLSTSTYKDTSNTGSVKIKHNTFGLGIYVTNSLGDKVSNYYGAKVSKSMVKFTFSDDAFNGSSDKNDYLTITPLVGFKYDATKSISAAFELGVNYTDGEETYSDVPDFDSDIEEYSLYAGLSMRYLFK